MKTIMIETYNKQMASKLYDLLDKEVLQNPYLYIDANTYGFQGNNIQTYYISCEEKIFIIIYQYYNSLQLLVNSKELIEEPMIKELAQFIISNKPVMVSGLTSLITKLKVYLSSYKQTDGCLFKYKDNSLNTANFPSFKFANTLQDFERLAAFITTDENIGGHYTPVQLAKQFLERHEKYGCQNIFLEENGKIIAHLGTYACYKNLAVLGGLLVDSGQRGKGLARKLMNFLSYQCANIFKQTPVFYCYIPTLFRFYTSCGYEKIYDSSKLELIGEKNA